MRDDAPLRTSNSTGTSVSRLAVASFVLGMLAWPLSCLTDGLIGMVAIMLGMIALDRIRASAGALRGKAFAWTGIGSGIGSVLVMLGAFLLLQEAQRQWNLELDAGVRRSFDAASLEDAEAALGTWSLPAGRALDAEELRAFAELARSRYGSFQALLVSDETASPDLLAGRHAVMLQVDFEFSSGRQPGSVRTVLAQTAGSVVPQMRIEGIVIDDPKAPGGRIEIPARRAPSEPATEKP
jgi:hypothetical protein